MMIKIFKIFQIAQIANKDTRNNCNFHLYSSASRRSTMQQIPPNVKRTSSVRRRGSMMQQMPPNVRKTRKGYFVMFFFALAALTGIKETGSMAVYDCGDPSTSFHTLDLLQPEQCPNPKVDFQTMKDQRIQIIQTQDDLPLEGQQCLVTITKEVQRCQGMASGAYGPPEFTVWEQVLKLTGKECEKAAKEKFYRYENKLIPVYEGTATHTWWSRGRRTASGSCSYSNKINGDTKGGFSSGGRIFTKHLEQTMATVKVLKIKGSVDVTERIVRFNDVRAAFDAGELHDGQQGTITWNNKMPSCTRTTSQIYLGQAKLYQRVGRQSLSRSVVMVENEENHQFAGLTLKGTVHICGTRCYATQLKGVMVCIIPTDSSPIPRRKFRPEFDQEKVTQGARLGHLVFETNLRVYSRFAEVQTDLCEVERKTAYNKLQALAGGDNAYALLDTYGRGHRVFKAGNVVHVAKCVEKEATVASFPNCTEEVPVRLQGTNRTMFADPYTWVLQDLATIIPCSSVTPVMWLVGGTWWKSTPVRTKEMLAPRTINMSSNPYNSLGDFTMGAGDSMYSEEQMSAHRQFQQSQNARKAVAQHITNTAIENAANDGIPGSPLNSFEVAQIRNIIGGFLFPLFPLLGKAWYSLMTILLIFNFTKITLSWLVKSYIMYQERGCGIWFIAAVSNAFFNLARTPMDLVKNLTANILNAPLEVVPAVHLEAEEEVAQAIKEEKKEKKREMKALKAQKKGKVGFLGRKTKQFFRKNEVKEAAMEEVVIKELGEKNHEPVVIEGLDGAKPEPTKEEEIKVDKADETGVGAKPTKRAKVVTDMKDPDGLDETERKARRLRKLARKVKELKRRAAARGDSGTSQDDLRYARTVPPPRPPSNTSVSMMDGDWRLPYRDQHNPTPMEHHQDRHQAVLDQVFRDPLMNQAFDNPEPSATEQVREQQRARTQGVIDELAHLRAKRVQQSKGQ
jgi:hypothetical protein